MKTPLPRFPAGSAEPSFANAASSCDPKTRPGKMVEKVLTPSTWGVAVRDDGLTYFAEPFENGVGITSTRTRTVDGFIASGSYPINLAFAPSGATAYVTNLFSIDVSVIDVASARQIATISTGDASTPSWVLVTRRSGPGTCRHGRLDGS